MKDTNELGIFEEAQRRREHFAGQSKALRRRILGGGPSYQGSTAQPVNPFDVPARLPLQRRPPFWRQHAESKVRKRLYDPRTDLDVNAQQIVQAVCSVANLTSMTLLGRDQCKRVARPRQAAIYLVANYCREYSLTQVARIFGRHHTTIMHAVVAVPRRIEHGDEPTRTFVDKVEALLRTVRP